jgi:pimeloyl-ACP methyl ester carboxylesterase
VIPKCCPSSWAAAVTPTATVGFDHLRRRGRCLRRAQPAFENHLPAAPLTFFPKSGHVVNLEEPALFNEIVERFIAPVEAGRWSVRDPRSIGG